ncbi:MAG TPA: hypothetical protein VFH31_13850, partial [Pyrinomonadaceae bacterium]|nr:hypothetical protein [Pyrinomonadaceae bacterium]
PPAKWAVLHVSGWRCVICGEIIDPVIVANRVSSEMPGNRWERLKLVVPLTSTQSPSHPPCTRSVARLRVLKA